MSGAILSLSNTHSRRGAQLKAQGQLYFTSYQFRRYLNAT
jgi:hypothetical protein